MSEQYMMGTASGAMQEESAFIKGTLPIKKDPPLAAALNELSRRMEAHRAAIALLVGRMQPVCTVEPPQVAKDPDVPVEAGSAVVRQLYSLAGELSVSTRTLNSLMLRLEV